MLIQLLLYKFCHVDFIGVNPVGLRVATPDFGLGVVGDGSLNVTRPMCYHYNMLVMFESGDF